MGLITKPTHGIVELGQEKRSHGVIWQEKLKADFAGCRTMWNIGNME